MTVVVLPGGVGSVDSVVAVVVVVEVGRVGPVIVVFPFPKTPIVFKDIIKIIRGATGAARGPKPGKAPIMAAAAAAAFYFSKSR